MAMTSEEIDAMPAGRGFSRLLCALGRHRMIRSFYAFEYLTVYLDHCQRCEPLAFVRASGGLLSGISAVPQ